MVALTTKIPSRSDSDWRAAKAPTKSFPKSFSGFIFVCDASMIPDLRRKIFGLPAGFQDAVRCIRRGMPLFLFNYSDRLLYGVYEAVSDGGYNIDPYAWGGVFTKAGRYSKPVSRYPAQVKIDIRNERPALEEEYFRSILEYEGNLLKDLELSAQQVEKLLELFDASNNELTVDTNGRSRNFDVMRSNGRKSPKLAYKSDSDCLSDTSSKSVNSGEEESNDESVNEKYCCRQDVVLSEGIMQIGIDEKKTSNGCFSAVPIVSADNQRLYYNNGRCKRPQRSEYEKPVSSRFDDDDPAVNSNGSSQIGLDQSVAVVRQDNVPMVLTMPPQFQFQPENLFLTSLQTIKSQQQGNLVSSNSHKSKWAEQKHYRGSSGNIKKKELGEGEYSRPKDHKVMKPNTSNDCEQATHRQSQNFQLQSFPVRMQMCADVQDSSHIPHLVSQVFLPQHAERLTVISSPVEALLDESIQGFETTSDVQMIREGIHLMPNRHFVCMPPVIARQPQPVSRFFVEELHYEILNFARWTRPSSEIQRHVEAAIDCVRSGVKAVWPNADIEVFGSFATGLCLQHSDVDLAVIDAPSFPSSEKLTITQASASLIRELAAALRTNDWCESINPLDTASMPVLKCRCRPFSSVDVTPIAVDITIGSIGDKYSSSNLAAQAADEVSKRKKFSTRHTGGAARDYVLSKIRELPALAPLVLLLKSILHHRDLSNVYSGGLGSFSLTLLVAFFLERVPVPPMDVSSDGSNSDSPTSSLRSSPLSCQSEFSDDSDSPSTSDQLGTSSSGGSSDYSGQSLGERYVRQAADAIERVLRLWANGDSPYLGSLLLGFLHSFGIKRDLSRDKIVLKGIDGSPGGIFEREDRHIALWIDDPLRPGVNIGAGSYGMVRVQNAFTEMQQVLTEGTACTPLQCLDKLCQDLTSITGLKNLSRLMIEAKNVTI